MMRVKFTRSTAPRPRCNALAGNSAAPEVVGERKSSPLDVALGMRAAKCQNHYSTTNLPRANQHRAAFGCKAGV